MRVLHGGDNCVDAWWEDEWAVHTLTQGQGGNKVTVQHQQQHSIAERSAFENMDKEKLPTVSFKVGVAPGATRKKVKL